MDSGKRPLIQNIFNITTPSNFILSPTAKQAMPILKVMNSFTKSKVS